MAPSGDITARLVYYGPQGSGKTTNVQFIHNKLKKDHRGELRTTQVPGRAPGVFEVLPVELGLLHGFKTSIHLHTVPGGAAHSEVRRRILEQTDGVVFVADLRPARHEATIASFGELRGHLQSHGRRLEDVVLVIQYNHRDEADENAVERLHRLLAARPAASFEAVATTGTGVLQTLTAISKFIVQTLRTRAQGGTARSTAPEPRAAEPQAAPIRAPEPPPPAASAPLRQAAEPPRPRPPAAVETEIPWPAASASSPSAAGPGPAISILGGKQLAIESVGPTDFSATELRIPIRLRSAAGPIELCVRVCLGEES